MKRILIIDDDRATRVVCKRWLEREGYSVDEAGDGVEGLRQLRGDTDAVICDIFMPTQNGVQTMQMLQEDASGVPVVAMTAGGPFGRALLADVSDRYGVSARLEKPFDRLELLAAVGAVLGPTEN